LPNPRGKNPPEWLLNISRKNDELLAAYTFSKLARTL
jgi:hypothetical protein